MTEKGGMCYLQIMLTHQTRKIWRKNHIFQQQESMKDHKTLNECFLKMLEAPCERYYEETV